MARTMLRRKRSAVISKRHSQSDSCSQRAERTWQMLVFTSVLVREKLVKSSYSSSRAAARFMASKSGTLTSRHERSRRKGDLRVWT